MNETYIKNVVEAALLAAGRSLQINELTQLFDESARPDEAGLRAAFAALEADYSSRGIEVKETSSGFRIQVRRDLANEVSRLWPERPPRYSRALLETLALIAYRQPITRGEIESVRGVAVNPNIIKTVIERNWVKVVGTRDVPGRPELLGTTQEFLDYFGLRSLDELPPLAELKAMGDVNLQLDLAKPGEGGDAAGAAAAGADGAAAAVDGSAAGTANAGAAVVAGEADAELGADASASAESGSQGDAPAASEASSEAIAADTAAISDERPEASASGANDADRASDAVASQDSDAVASQGAPSAALDASGEEVATDTTAESLEVEPDTTSQAVAHMEIESDSGDVTVEVEALSLIEARIEASIESDDPQAVSDSQNESASGAEAAAAVADVAEPVAESAEPFDTTLETGEFEMSELGVEADDPKTSADVIEAEFEADDLTNAVADSDDAEEADDEEELSASSSTATKFVAGPRDNED